MNARLGAVFICAGLFLPEFSQAASVNLTAQAEGQGIGNQSYPPPSASYSTGVVQEPFDPLDYSSASAAGSFVNSTLSARVDVFGNSANGAANVGLYDTLTFSLPPSMSSASVTVYMDVSGSVGGAGTKQGLAQLSFGGTLDRTIYPSGGDMYRTYAVTKTVTHGASLQLVAAVNGTMSGEGSGQPGFPRLSGFIEIAPTTGLSIVVPEGVTYTTESGYQLPTRGLTGFTLSTSTVAGCKNVSGKVTLSQPAPATGTVVEISDTLASATAPLSITVPAGATTKSVAIKTVPVGESETGKLSATLQGRTLSQPLTVRPMGPQSVTLTPTSVVGSQPVAGKATLECKAGPGPIVVDLSSDNAAVASPVAASIVVPQGLQSANFDVATNAVQAKSYATMAGTANGITKTKKLTVNVAAVVSPTSLKFGSVAVGATSGVLNATLTNKGAVAFSVTGISLSGTAASWFAQSHNCPASLAAGASCTISVTFTPQAAATRSAKLRISTSATSTPLSVSLSGTGI